MKSFCHFDTFHSGVISLFLVTINAFHLTYLFFYPTLFILLFPLFYSIIFVFNILHTFFLMFMEKRNDSILWNGRSTVLYFYFSPYFTQLLKKNSSFREHHALLSAHEDGLEHGVEPTRSRKIGVPPALLIIKRVHG